MITIVGLGQHVAGDDAAGLAVLDEVERRGIGNTTLVRARDASQLVELLDGDCRYILVDAVLVEPHHVGKVFVLSPDQLDERANSSVSSHGLSVAQAIQLARALHTHSTPQIQLVAIGITRPRLLEQRLSNEVKAAVTDAANTIEALVRAGCDE